MTPMTEADAALMGAFLRQEPDAARQLYDRFASRIYGLGLFLLRNKTDAEDLVQDTFLKIWRTGSAFDPLRGSLDAWILLNARGWGSISSGVGPSKHGSSIPSRRSRKPPRSRDPSGARRWETSTNERVKRWRTSPNGSAPSSRSPTSASARPGRPRCSWGYPTER